MLNMQQNKTYLVVGAGAIGTAIATELAKKGQVHIAGRQATTAPSMVAHPLANWSEESLSKLAERLPSPLAGVFVAVGMLYSENIQPEKALAELDPQALAEVYQANAIVPALCGKYFLPLLDKQTPSFFAALSARVGSVSDNSLGGWYSYRMSKAALNMFIKTASIEVARKNKQATIIGLHPGTVDSALSKPFQRNVPAGKLFTPEHSAQQLVAVLEGLTPEHTGKCFDYSGQEITP